MEGCAEVDGFYESIVYIFLFLSFRFLLCPLLVNSLLSIILFPQL